MASYLFVYLSTNNQMHKIIHLNFNSRAFKILWVKKCSVEFWTFPMVINTMNYIMEFLCLIFEPTLLLFGVTVSVYQIVKTLPIFFAKLMAISLYYSNFIVY